MCRGAGQQLPAQEDLGPGCPSDSNPQIRKRLGKRHTTPRCPWFPVPLRGPPSAQTHHRPRRRPIHALIWVLEQPGCANCSRYHQPRPHGRIPAPFFPNERRDCPDCGVEQTRRHILDVCTRYTRWRFNFLEFLKNSSDPRADFLAFLTDNPSAFSLTDGRPSDDYPTLSPLHL
jgi:hypothetical protein